MRIKIVALLLVLIFVSSVARAAPRFEFGPGLSWTEPAGDAAGHLSQGIALGATSTWMRLPTLGLGLDLVYHGWPRPARLTENWDVSLSALQATAHVKLLAPGPAAPWVEAGAGGYLVFRDYPGRPGGSSYEPGYFGSVGIDFDITSGMRFGYDASYQRVSCRSQVGFDVTMYSLGMHLLIRR